MYAVYALYALTPIGQKVLMITTLALLIGLATGTGIGLVASRPIAARRVERHGIYTFQQNGEVYVVVRRDKDAVEKRSR